MKDNVKIKKSNATKVVKINNPNPQFKLVILDASPKNPYSLLSRLSITITSLKDAAQETRLPLKMLSPVTTSQKASR